MGFGEKIRDLRQSRNLTQRELGELVGVTFTYISKVENERLDFGDYPSEVLIRKLSAALDSEIQQQRRRPMPCSKLDSAVALNRE